jgi:holo-[acyl-carrier protein] synthase
VIDGLTAGVTGVIGIGTDLVEVERFRLALTRRPTLAERLFSDDEREYAARFRDPTKSLAARFGAKEAVMKAMGVGLWKFALRDVEVVKRRSGEPVLALHDKAAALAAEKGVREWRLTLTHTDSMAMAVALALG